MKYSCSGCSRKFQKDELEEWGDYLFCKDCICKHLKRGNPQKKDTYEIKFGEINPLMVSGYDMWGSYDVENGDLLLFVATENNIELLINHEFLHHIIHKLIGLKECYQFDKVDHFVHNWE
jgi:DNA-directed RNA polymerase subunit RPC12/RpoP